jgi:starch phosphorylase
MKAAANGVLNLSILDGWWDEAYTPRVGWAIGRREDYEDQAYQDQVETEALYGLLEREVVPTFYDRGPDGLPRRWILRMKAAIQELTCFFNTHRMVGEYTEKYYLPAAEHYWQLTADGMAMAKKLAGWKTKIAKHWGKVRINSIQADSITKVKVGEEFQVEAKVFLGDLKPDDVSVELCFGKVDPVGDISDSESAVMGLAKQEGDGIYIYKASGIKCHKSGLHGYTARVLPYHADLTSSFLPGFIVWA